MSARIAMVADVLSFLGSAFFLSRIGPAEPPTEESGRHALTAGARFIKSSAIVRSSLIAAATINFFNFVFFALFVLYATRSLHVRPGLLGLVLGAGAIGGVLGAAVTRRLAARLGVGLVCTLACLVFTAPLVLVPLAGGLAGTFIGLRPTLWIAAIGGMTGVAWLLPSPLPKFRMPSDSGQSAKRPAAADPVAADPVVHPGRSAPVEQPDRPRSDSAVSRS